MPSARSPIFIALSLLLAVLAGPLQAQNTVALREGVLALPLQTDAGLATEHPYLGLAVQNVMENMLTLHSGLVERWAVWDQARLFPNEEVFREWLREGKSIPTGVAEVGMRYLITGRVRGQSGAWIIDLELLDRATQKTWSGALAVDTPALLSFRQAFLDLLARAGLPAPESQRPKMLWREDITREALSWMGQGLYEDAVNGAYRGDKAIYTTKRYEEGLRSSPRSYLLLNNLAWLLYRQKKYVEAKPVFERALTVNPEGADAADGMLWCEARSDGDAAAETWAVRKAALQGRPMNLVLAQLWNWRGNSADREKNYARAVACYLKAIDLHPKEVDYVTNLASTYRKAERFEEGQHLLQAASAQFPSDPDQKALQMARADLHFYWARSLEKKQDYEGAAAQYLAAYEIDRLYRPKDAALAMNGAGVNHARLRRYSEALQCFEQALALRRSLPERAEEIVVLHNLSAAYKNLRRYDDALRHNERALATAREVKDRASEGHTLNYLGQIYDLMRQYDQAIASYQQALTIKRELKDRAGEGALLFNIAVALASRTDYGSGVEHYNQALAIAREVKDRALEALILNGLGLVSENTGRSDQAIDYYKRGLAIRRELLDRSGEALALSNLGDAHKMLRRMDEATAYYRQSLDAARASKDPSSEIGALSNLGNIHQDLTLYEEAISYFEQALAIARKMKDASQEADILNYLGNTYDSAKRRAQALAHYERALAAARTANNPRTEAVVLNNLGATYRSAGQSEKAMAYHQQALEKARALRDFAQQATILNGIGQVYAGLTQYDRALELYEQGLTVARGAKYRWAEMRALGLIGGVYNEMSRPDRAVSYHEQKRALAAELNDRVQEATAFAGLGASYYALKEHEKARAMYVGMLDLARAAKSRSDEAMALNGLGAVHYALRQYGACVDYFRQALDLSRALKDNFGIAYALNGLGAAAYLNKQYDQSIIYLEQGLAMRREQKERSSEGTSLLNLMVAWRSVGKPRLAIFYGKLAVNVWQEIRSNLNKESQDFFIKSKEQSYRDLADLLIAEGRLPEAQQVLDLLKEQEYFDFLRRDGNEASALKSRADLTTEEAEWERRYRLIADRVTAIGTERGALLAKAARTTAEDRELTRLESDLQVANEAYQKFLDQLAREFGRSKERGDKIYNLRESQSLMSDLRDMGSSVVALYTLVGEEKYRVILTTPDTQKAAEYAISAAELNRKVLAFRQALQTRGLDPLPLAQELYRIILAPVAGDLEGAQAQTLMWSLDGVLRYVPMGALHDGKQYLVERYRHVVFTPASQARLKDRPSAHWKGLGLGVSKAQTGFDPLPAVESELRGIIHETGQPAANGILPGTVKLNEAFTADSMLASLRQRYPLVHIASHFQFRPGNETNSFLLLGDGSHLTLAQVKRYPNIFEKVELLTLSACNTATGDAGASGSEVEGFGVLAQRQGAKAVLASLWSVADESTRDLMQTFYQRREKQTGISKIEALRQAQLSLLYGARTPAEVAAATADRLRAAPPSSAAPQRFKPDAKAPHEHPFYWAPFILIGNWQ